MYDPKTAKAEASQRSLLKIVDGGHVLADHSFDHMNHNSNDSPRNAYTNVEQDMVSCSSVLTYLLQNSKKTRILKLRPRLNVLGMSSGDLLI
jgi:peptidoglycan/xylan/chitin deacetylase (PgdA/CDA1 family)